MIMDCDHCNNNVYDEEYDEYYCDVDLDEDEMAHYMSRSYSHCPYFVDNDEYKIVRHQM